MRKLLSVKIALVAIGILATVAGCSDELVSQPTLVASDIGCGDGYGDASCGDGGTLGTNDGSDNGGDGVSPCDDQNPCTIDGQDTASKCIHQPVPDATTCDDGNACTTLETCQAGQCVQGIDAGNCNDGNACTTDSCNPKNGTCIHSNNDNSCDDGNSCTSGDMCKNGSCVAGAALDCDDKNLCTTDTCESKSGCKNTPLNCDDQNDCTMDSCDSKSGCVSKAKFDGTSCEDGDQCTSGDKCMGGICKGGAAPSCDDNNVCTADTCVLKQGCVHAPLTGQACDDGNSNTISDVCTAGVCVGGAPSCDDKNACTTDSGDPANGVPCTNVPLTCNDGNVCTTDKCDVKNGCLYVNNAVACNDNDACTVGESCKAGVCGGGLTPVCNDNNTCTMDTCDPSKGCVFTNLAGVACDDGSVCTTSDTCDNNGTCKGGPAKSCDDSNSCTADSCDPLVGCKHSVLSGTTCDDNNLNTVNDVCGTNGTCKGSNIACDDGNACTLDSGNVPGCTYSAITCDDKILCTTDTCDPTKGCVFTPNVLPCDDGNVCTTGDACSGGTCKGGPAPSCDDGNSCTTDSCDVTVVGNCKHVALSGTACDDGNVNTVNDSCSTGTCKGQSVACNDGNVCTIDGGDVPNCTYATVTCDDKNPCTNDTCDPTKGCVFLPNAATCSDGSVCTTGDVCSAGTCKGTSKCDDGDPCTTDSCSITTGACTATYIPGCGIGEICGDGKDNDGDGKIDCQDSECGSKALAIVFHTYGPTGATVDFVTADKPGVVQSLPVDAYKLYCAEVPFTATVKSTKKGTLHAWVEGTSGTTPEEKIASAPKFWAFDIFESIFDLKPSMTDTSFQKKDESFKVTWPPSKK